MRNIAAILLMLLGLTAAGQNVVTNFAKGLSEGCAVFGFTYSMTGQVPLNGSGTVRLQGDAFVMKGDGLEVYCDGATRWTVDTAAEECYIEAVKPGSLDYEANPALLVGAVDEAFKLKRTASSTFNGSKVTEAVLTPKTTGGNITELSLMLATPDRPAGLLVRLDDGNVITVVVKDYELVAAGPVEGFRLDTKKLNRNYIITDLR